MTVTYGYYRDVYGGCRGEEIIPWLRSAFVLICGCVSIYDEDRMKYAACIQADHEYSVRYSSVSIGDFSARLNTDGGELLCAEARMYLDGGGLMYRGTAIG